MRDITAPPVIDRFHRPLRDMRISVTDRCNFRCVYCMPKEIYGLDHKFADRSELLTFEEITKLARIGTTLGVEKIRLTGGEPLLRRGIEALIEQLSELTTAQGRPLDIALTTNGSALAVKAAALKDAGLQRVTVSLDSLDDARFQQINDVKFPVAKVLAGIEVAQRAGLAPIKINAVIKRGVNDDEILPLVEKFRGTGCTLRFIEYMDVGSTNGWLLSDVVPSAEVIDRINAVYPLEPLDPAVLGETARRWRFRDGQGELGVISSVTQAFCGSCTRARISAEGKLFTCLFATTGVDLKELLRSGADDDSVRDALSGIWRNRQDRYSEERAQLSIRSELQTQNSARSRDANRIEMSYIGG